MESPKNPRIQRRRLLATATSAALAATMLLGVLPPPGASAAEGPRSSLITDENAKEGSLDWQLTRVRLDSREGYRAPNIEGYCSKQSVAVGESLDIMVSTDPAEKFIIEIFRTGYYGGRGARLMAKYGPFQGKAQPVPEPARGDRHLIECTWEPAMTLGIRDDWPSGVYLGRLTTLGDKSGFGYWQNYVVFIVRDSRPADILFQCSDNTWQAYNRWPDKYSVYTHPKGNQGPWADVSFDRPYGLYPQGFIRDPQTLGSGEWLCFEFPFAYWLEKHGYDVSYCSNSDMIDPARAAIPYKVFLSVGHDEYWDIRQYENALKMRDETGVNLMFFSGNSVCWVTPLQDSSSGQPNRIMFRGGPYGGEYEYAVTREEMHGPFPHRGPDEGFLIGARNVKPVNGAGDWVVEKPEHWIFEGTGMKKGDLVRGLVGWEFHGDPPDIPGLEVLARGTALRGGTQPKQWEATIYPGPKDNFVFNASTIFWCQDLSSPPGHQLPWSHWARPHGPDERVQRITHNLLERAIK